MAENTPKTNPLASIMRQPKIYITLPSKGRFWPEGSLNPTVNGEYPVFSMTARDEITLKTPDALLNGQGIVDVIQSCIPNILNAWDAPQIDLDAILVAIRIATYGEEMNLEVNHASMKESMDFKVNLREILDSIQQRTTWEERFEINPSLVVYLKPINYQVQSMAQNSEFETQRMMSIIRDQDLDEETKLKAFRETFEKLTLKSLDVIHFSIYKVESPSGTTEDSTFIKEFVTNCDAEIFDTIKKRLDALMDQNKLPPLTVASTPEMREEGAPEVIEVPFSFDTANFFG